MIVWLGIERSAFPKRTGMKDFDLIDLPFPLRKLRYCQMLWMKDFSSGDLLDAIHKFYSSNHFF